MNDFFGLLVSMRGIARSTIVLLVGLFLMSQPNILSDNQITLWDMISLTQSQLSWVFVSIAIIDFAGVLFRFFNADFSEDFAGIYRASFGYDAEGIKSAILKLGHPVRWGEGKDLVCPTKNTSDEWEAANSQEMSEVDRRIDPDSQLYGEFLELKTHLSVYLNAVRSNPAKQVYSFSGFGIVDDEQLANKGSHSSYVNLLVVDSRSPENKMAFDNPFQLLLFMLLGRKIVLRIDQRVTAHSDTEHPIIPIYLHLRIKYRPWLGLFVDGPGVIYLNLINADRYVANTYTVDGGWL